MSDLILPIILAVIAASPGVIALLSSRRKTDADTKSVEVSILQSTLQIIKGDNAELRTRIDAQDNKLDEYREDLDGTRAEIDALTQSLQNLKQEFFESERANRLLQAAVIERDKEIIILRARIVELENQLAQLKNQVNGDDAV